MTPPPASSAGRVTRWKIIQLDRVQSNGYVFQVEMAYLCQRLNLRVLEIADLL